MGSCQGDRWARGMCYQTEWLQRGRLTWVDQHAVTPKRAHLETLIFACHLPPPSFLVLLASHDAHAHGNALPWAWSRTIMPMAGDAPRPTPMPCRNHGFATLSKVVKCLGSPWGPRREVPRQGYFCNRARFGVFRSRVHFGHFRTRARRRTRAASPRSTRSASSPRAEVAEVDSAAEYAEVSSVAAVTTADSDGSLRIINPFSGPWGFLSPQTKPIYGVIQP